MSTYRVKWRNGATFPQRFFMLEDAKAFIKEHDKKHEKDPPEIELIIVEE